ncbi:hypothetical protein HL658_03690 [Azospirillum sp. RWY-5-1]|uniref:Lipoprotein n=1 Tax=Azospirillum oleiclasticum TaxID=2735135 RepID=A0ABX2T696_9PROT|nr:hypothetical protein [Azospirillum oleiclasticum]NYZ11640.1 hypothetical protein [Azospirillum oleiclasticum]NYZ18801.1 hypothetical protein [Azospirillum oleiclasticum]
MRIALDCKGVQTVVMRRRIAVKKAIIALCASLALAGCVTPPKQGYVLGSRWGGAPTVASVKVIDDPFQNHLTFEGPKFLYEDYDAILDDNAAMIRSWINRSGGSPTHQIYVFNEYRGCSLRNWFQAVDEDRNNLQFVKIFQSERKCDSSSNTVYQYEVFGAEVKDSVLRDRQNSGYAVRFYSRKGNFTTVIIPKDVIRIQLEAVDGRLALLTTNQNSRPTNPTSTTSRNPDSTKPNVTVKQGQNPTKPNVTVTQSGDPANPSVRITITTP